MERETGFEPATSTLATWGSTTELFPHIIKTAFCHGLGKPATSACVTIGSHVLLIKRAGQRFMPQKKARRRRS